MRCLYNSWTRQSSRWVTTCWNWKRSAFFMALGIFVPVYWFTCAGASLSSQLRFHVLKIIYFAQTCAVCVGMSAVFSFSESNKVYYFQRCRQKISYGCTFHPPNVRLINHKMLNKRKQCGYDTIEICIGKYS